MLSTSLLDLSTLFGWVGEGYGLKKGSSYMHIIVSKTRSKISSSCEKNNNQNWPSVPTNFFNDCSYWIELGSNLQIIDSVQGGSRTTSLTWEYIEVCGYSDRFCNNLNQRSLTPRWLLTPHLLRPYVRLYPRINVSKSHENTSKYVDTVTFFAKTWTKGHWPLDEVPWEYIKVCGYSDFFWKKLELKVIDP